MLSVNQIHSKILEYVGNNPGCGAAEIVVNAKLSDPDCSLDLPIVLETMVDKGELTQIDYSVPNGTFKSIYFLHQANIYCERHGNTVLLRSNGVLLNHFPPNTKMKITR